MKNSEYPVGRRLYNEKLSSLRVHIEQSFGMLVAKWRILRTVINVAKAGTARAMVEAPS